MGVERILSDVLGYGNKREREKVGHVET